MALGFLDMEDIQICLRCRFVDSLVTRTERQYPHVIVVLQNANVNANASLA